MSTKLALLALAGCSAAPPSAPSQPAHAIVQPAPVSGVPAAPDAALPPEPEPESVTEHAQVAGPDGLRVDVTWQTLTGTTHVATELAITTPAGTLRLAGDDFGGDALPLVDRALGAGPHRWILLGWSSYGEGMQSEHAWLVEDGPTQPRVVDALVWTSDRAHAGLALDPLKLRLGIPLPDAEELHDAGDWSLHHGTQRLSLAGIEKLPAREMHLMTLPAFYDPPFGDEPSTRHWAGRFVWFQTKPKGFARD